MNTKTVSIDQIIPYWRNPRRIPNEAVNAVAESIQRYGYQQPIVVDEDMTIIIGHTRYAALRRLNTLEVEVLIVDDLPGDKVKQLRVLDNRVGEFTSWDYEKLVAELSSLDATLMTAFFPEIDLGQDDGPSFQASADPAVREADVDHTAEFICPNCFHSWSMEVSVESINKGLLRERASS